MRFRPTALLAIAALCGATTFAQARPPTVMPSPGYDARLQESRKALGGATAVAPANPPAIVRKRPKRKR